MADSEKSPPDTPAAQRGAPSGTALSRAALERVLTRAAQLQAASGEGDDTSAMTEEQLVDLGKEVGLSADLLRQALAEERSRSLVPAEAGWLAALTGPSAVTAARTVPGNAAAVLGVIDAWMQREESLQVKRRFTDQLVWEARRDLISMIRRVLPIRGRGFELIPANEVSAIVSGVGAAKSHVRVVADFTEARSQRATTGVAIAALLMLTAVPLLTIAVAPLLAVIPPALAGIVALFVTRRQYRQLVARAQVALEQVLDRLEFADAKPPTTAQVLLDAFMGAPRPPGK